MVESSTLFQPVQMTDSVPLTIWSTVIDDAHIETTTFLNTGAIFDQNGWHSWKIGGLLQNLLFLTSKQSVYTQPIPMEARWLQSYAGKLRIIDDWSALVLKNVTSIFICI